MSNHAHPTSPKNSAPEQDSRQPASEANPLQAKIDRLERLTEWFYGDDFQLDQALAHYQTAIELATEIQSDLKHLANQVEILHENFTK